MSFGILEFFILGLKRKFPPKTTTVQEKKNQQKKISNQKNQKQKKLFRLIFMTSANHLKKYEALPSTSPTQEKDAFTL